ncbi:MAG: hypothetical protein ABSA47_19970, partial [Verrucomicrobiota bacterium]
MGEKAFIDRPHHVLRHQAEVVAVQVPEGQQFALAGFKSAGGGKVGGERFVADDSGERGVVNLQFVAQERLLEQLCVEIVLDLNEKRLSDHFGKVFVGAAE